MAPIFLLLLSIALFRTAPWLSGDETVLAGWAPMMGFALCGGAFLPRRLALWLPAVAILVTGGVINELAGRPVVNVFSVVVAACSVGVAAAGAVLKKKASLAALLGTSVLSTVLFHLVSNTVSFFWDPGYAKTLAGWWQCQTTGLPGYLPTWVFTLRQLAGDLMFTAAFFACCRHSLPTRGTLPAPTPAAA